MPSNREIRPRGQSLKELGLEPLNVNHVSALKRRYETFLFEKLGLALGADGSVPNSGLVIPRMFWIGPDANGENKPRWFSDAKFKPGDPEFFEQIRMGNVFVYPVGEAEPVQLQIDIPKGGIPVLHYSKALQPEQMPLREVPPLSRWESFWNRLSFGSFYRRRRQARDRYKQEREHLTQKLRDDSAGRSKLLDRERLELETEKERRAEKERQNQLRKDMEEAKEEMDAVPEGKKQFVSVFKPAPDKLEKLLARKEEHPMGKREHFYNEEQFRELTVLTDNEAEAKKRFREQDAALSQKYGRHPDVDAGGKPYKFRAFDQKGILIGGKPVTDEQFAGLALAACWGRKLAMENAKHDKNYDPTLDRTLQSMGWSEEDCEMTVETEPCNIGTTDLFMKKRDNEGRTFSFYVDPGRIAAAEALEAYRKGDSGPLAEMIAQGVNRIAQELRNISTPEKMNNEPRAALIMGGELASLLEQDPALKKLAEERGMKPERFTAIQGAVKIVRMEQEALEAQYLLAKARAEHTVLTREQKRACAEKLLRGKLALRTLRSERVSFEQREDTDYYRFANGGIQRVEPPVRREGNPPRNVPVPKEEWPILPAGQVYNCSYQKVFSGAVHRQMPIPGFPAMLLNPEKAERFEQTVQQIVRQEKLEDKSVEELYRDLKLNGRESRLDLGESSRRAREALGKPDSQMQQEEKRTKPEQKLPSEAQSGKMLN